MSKRTNKLGLTYFEKDDFTSSLPEMQRWETIDVQLNALFQIIGNGVISGWNIVASSGLNATVTSGSGHVSFVAVQSTSDTNVGLTSQSTNYIYASLNSDSYWTKGVSFSSSVFENTGPNFLLIGYVVTDDNSITEINMDAKATLGFTTLVNNAIKSHRHIGGTENPDPINLAKEVQGFLSQNNIPPLDASIVSAGILDPDRLPLIDHISKMTNQGELTHSQLDSFVNSLSLPDQSTMGEVSTINLLQLILALKHIYPDIDEFLVNELAFIPGISPDDYIDTVNTTAQVDIRPSSEGGTHKITGSASTGFDAYTRIWNTEESFGEATLSNTVVSGDSIVLNTTEDTLIIEEFADITTWAIETQDLSSIPSSLIIDTSTYVVAPNSAKLTISNENVEVILKIKKTFNAQDWRGYDYLRFYIKTESIEHGDLFFYLNDSYYGAQNSYTKVLNKNAPSINIETLEAGWQEVTINLKGYSRQYINEIGFYVSTQNGWDTSKGFSFNLDNIYLTSGNIYEIDGYARFIFGSDFLYQFWRMRWEDIIPTDSESVGVSLQVRTRVANTISGLSTAPWSDYFTVSDYAIPTVDDMYKYIEIEFYFTSSTNRKRSIVLKKAYLDFYATDIDSSFTYSTKADWDGGYQYNIDTTSVANSIVISNTSEIGNIYYGVNGKIIQANDNLVELFEITGTMMPRSTYQILNGTSASFGLITAISAGNNGSFWICDTDNDRVVEVDRKGNAVRGFFGSYLIENVSNANSTTTTTTTLATAATSLSNLNVISALYNSNKGLLYIIVDRDMTNDELLLFKGKYIKIGANRFYVDDFITTKAITGFDHVIKVQIAGADLTMLNSLVCPSVPSITILSPYQNQDMASPVTAQFLVSGFTLGVGSGENGIRITLDGSIIGDIYSTTVNLGALASGFHTLKAQLLNGDSSLNTNIEAVAEETFIVGTITTEPYIYIKSPKANQIFSSSPVQIEFAVENFPIVPNGTHIKYIIDGIDIFEHYSSDSVLIEDLSAGYHYIQMYLVDESGNDLGYTYGSVTFNFIVGNNSQAVSKFYYEINGDTRYIPMDVCNMVFSDVYAPFDVQYIPFDESTLSVQNTNGKESVLIGKLTNDYIVSKLT